jgi:hypothetical protein
MEERDEDDAELEGIGTLAMPRKTSLRDASGFVPRRSSLESKESYSGMKRRESRMIAFTQVATSHTPYLTITHATIY